MGCREKYGDVSTSTYPTCCDETQQTQLKGPRWVSLVVEVPPHFLTIFSVVWGPFRGRVFLAVSNF